MDQMKSMDGNMDQIGLSVSNKGNPPVEERLDKSPALTEALSKNDQKLALTRHVPADIFLRANFGILDRWILLKQLSTGLSSVFSSRFRSRNFVTVTAKAGAHGCV